MGIKAAIDKAKTRARREAVLNNWGDSMIFVVLDEGRYIVMSEWSYDLGQGIGDIPLAAATVWSDGQAVEVERYLQ